jgi:hypothetical protein
MRIIRFLGFGCLCLGLALLLSRCGRDTDLMRATPGTFADVYSIMQIANCTQCHVPGGGSGGSTIDLTSQAKAFGTIARGSVSGQQADGPCAGLPLVTAKNPAQSYLLYEMFGAVDPNYAVAAAHFSAKPKCRPAVVAGHNVNLSQSMESSVVAWINAGMPNN